jgi:hypothetical protein
MQATSQMSNVASSGMSYNRLILSGNLEPRARPKCSNAAIAIML